MLLVTNEEAMEAQKLFEKLEGIDIEPAAGVALASLMQAVKEQRVEGGCRDYVEYHGWRCGSLQERV